MGTIQSNFQFLMFVFFGLVSSAAQATYNVPALQNGAIPGVESESLYRSAVSLIVEKEDSVAACMGVLIEQDVVLTAGHCVKDAVNIEARLFSEVTNRWTVRTAKKWTYHPRSSPPASEPGRLRGDDDFLYVDQGAVLIDPVPDYNVPMKMLENYVTAGDEEDPIYRDVGGKSVALQPERRTPLYIVSRDYADYMARVPHPLTVLDVRRHSRPGDSRSVVFSARHVGSEERLTCAGDSGAPVLAVRDGVVGIVGVLTQGRRRIVESEEASCDQAMIYSNTSLNLPYVQKMIRTLYQYR